MKLINDGQEMITCETQVKVIYDAWEMVICVLERATSFEQERATSSVQERATSSVMERVIDVGQGKIYVAPEAVIFVSQKKVTHAGQEMEIYDAGQEMEIFDAGQEAEIYASLENVTYVEEVNATYALQEMVTCDAEEISISAYKKTLLVSEIGISEENTSDEVS